MKKKVISVILAAMVVLSLVACGGSSEPAATQEEVADFTILDVTADLVDVGIYAVDDSNITRKQTVQSFLLRVMMVQ